VSQPEEHKEQPIIPTLPPVTEPFGQGVQTHGQLMGNADKGGTSFTPIIVMLIALVMVAQYVRTHYFQRDTAVKGSVADKLLGGMNQGNLGTSHEMQEY